MPTKMNHAVSDLAYSPVPPVSTGPVVLTCTVSPPSGSGDPEPTGSVTFLDGNGDTLATVDLASDGNGNGVASTSVTCGLGSYTYSCNYSGDAFYLASDPAATTSFSVDS